MSKYNVELFMGLNSENAESGLQNVTRKLQEFSQNYDRYVTQNLKKLFDVDSWKEVADTQMILKQLVGDSFKDVKNSVEELANTTNRSLSEMSEAALAFARAGKTDNLEKYIEAAHKLSLVTGQELEGSVNSLLKVINTYNVDVSEASLISAKLSAAANGAAMDMYDLDTAMQYVLAAAAGAGLEVETLNAMLMVMADAGIKGSKAGTRVKNAIKELSDNAYMLSYRDGINVFDEDGNMRAMDLIFGEIGAHLDSLGTDEAKSDWLNSTFNTRAGDAIRILAREYEDLGLKMEELQAIDEDFIDSKAEGMAESAAYKMDLFTTALEALRIEMVENLIPAMLPVVDFLTNMVALFGALNQSTQTGVALTAAAGIGFGVLMTILSGLATMLTTLVIPAISLVGAAIGALSLPIILIGAAVGALVVVIIKYWDEIKEYFVSFTADFKGDFSHLLEWFKGVWTTLKIFFISLWQSIEKIIVGVFKIIGATVKAYIGLFTGDFEMMWEALKILFSGIGDLLMGIFGVVLTVFFSIVNVVINIINGIILGFQTLINTFIRGINSVINLANKVPGVDIPLVGEVSWGGDAIPKIAEEELKLAKGGLAYGETTAVVGDNPNAKSDPEVIAPLSKLKSYMPDNESSSAPIYLYVDGKKIAEAVNKHNVKNMRIHKGIRV